MRPRQPTGIGPPRCQLRFGNQLSTYHLVMRATCRRVDPNAGAPYWYWLGGRPALDFVNTRRERWRRDVECLLTVDEVVAGSCAPVCCRRAMRAPAAARRGARAARGDRHRRAGGGRAPRARSGGRRADRQLARARRRRARARGRRQRPAGARPSAPRGVAAPRARDGRARRRAHARHPGRARRACASARSETCSARFYDRSPAGRRRWCSMAACGNDEKARRHRPSSQGET